MSLIIDGLGRLARAIVEGLGISQTPLQPDRIITVSSRLPLVATGESRMSLGVSLACPVPAQASMDSRVAVVAAGDSSMLNVIDFHSQLGELI